MPNTIADFIGDNVNDIAGINATMQYQMGKIDGAMLKAMFSYPMLLAAGGTLILGGIAAYYSFTDQATNLDFHFGRISPWIASICGIISGIAIDKITEYYTGIDKKPVRKVAEYQREGEAFNITKGDAVGERSCLGPSVVIGLAIIIAFVTCGMYGITIASAGMLSFVGTIMSIIMAGALIGAALIKYFSGILTDNTIDSAYKMAEEGERQLAIPSVLERKVAPDYDKVITMASDEALRKMLQPSLMMLLVPVFGGLLFGAEFVGGILIGATLMAISDAVFMGNPGGAYDNAKKYIESGYLEGCAKGSPAHKAAASGDTVGDIRKDVVGVALDIGIKLMSTVANSLAPLFASAHLF